jgi:hypothetical protein
MYVKIERRDCVRSARLPLDHRADGTRSHGTVAEVLLGRNISARSCVAEDRHPYFNTEYQRERPWNS